MTDDQARPPAALSADRIKRGAAPIIIDLAPASAALPPPIAEAALRQQIRETVSAHTESGGAAAEAELRQQIRESVSAHTDSGGAVAVVADFFNWRRAGVFGLVYLGALAIFAAAFDIWPFPD